MLSRIIHVSRSNKLVISLRNSLKLSTSSDGHGLSHSPRRDYVCPTFAQKKSQTKLRVQLGAMKDSPIPLQPITRGKRKSPTAPKLKVLQTKEDKIELDTELETDNKILSIVRANVRKYPGTVILTRVGDFYELYEDQAAKYGRMLNIKVVKKLMSGSPVDFTGFPARALESYLNELVTRHGCRVAICEQFQVADAETGKKRFDRKISRIFTPGTVVEDMFLDPSIYNFLLSISFPMISELTPDSIIGLSWIDLSTGDFFTQSTNFLNLPDDLARINPAEIILPSTFSHCKEHPIPYLIQTYPTTFVSPANFASELGLAHLQRHFPNTTIQSPSFSSLSTSSSLAFSTAELSATAALTAYINETQLGAFPQLQPPTRLSRSDVLQLDIHALSSLELVRELSSPQRKAGSLLSNLDNTKTRAGSRTMSEWITAPLTDLTHIMHRQSVVEFFMKNSHILHEVREALVGMGDPARAVQKLALGVGGPSDCFVVGAGIKGMESVMEVFEIAKGSKGWEYVANVLNNIKPPVAVREYIEKAIEERTGGMSKSEAEKEGFIKKSFSEKIASLHRTLDHANVRKSEFEQRLINAIGQSRYDPKLFSASAHGAIIELTGTHYSRIKNHKDWKALELVKAKGKGGKFKFDEWTKISAKIEETKTKIAEEEMRIFDKAKALILHYSAEIIRNVRLISQIDVLASFAVLAIREGYVRPELDYSTDIEIVGGRHPVVEHGLATQTRAFVPNDLRLNGATNIWILTGPNMGGKSTFLRQNAIIVIMAQMGAFVPATKARIGVVDRVFSRVGASDNLFKNQSTFLVEMLETANILKNATDHSFVIMDELGRGTSTQEGLALAYATLHHLHEKNRCRVLFATHFKELGPLLRPEENPAKCLEGVEFWQTSVIDEEETFTLIHNIKPGICQSSYGIQVARMAGIPNSVLAVAKATLPLLQMGKVDKKIIPEKYIVSLEETKRMFEKEMALLEEISMDQALLTEDLE